MVVERKSLGIKALLYCKKLDENGIIWYNTLIEELINAVFIEARIPIFFRRGECQRKDFI